MPQDVERPWQDLGPPFPMTLMTCASEMRGTLWDQPHGSTAENRSYSTESVKWDSAQVQFHKNGENVSVNLLLISMNMFVSEVV